MPVVAERVFEIETDLEFLIGSKRRPKILGCPRHLAGGLLSGRFVGMWTQSVVG